MVRVISTRQQMDQILCLIVSYISDVQVWRYWFSRFQLKPVPNHRNIYLEKQISQVSSQLKCLFNNNEKMCLQWSDIIGLVHSSSLCTRHGLMLVLHKARYTNAKLAKIYPLFGLPSSQDLPTTIQHVIAFLQPSEPDDTSFVNGNCLSSNT